MSDHMKINHIHSLLRKGALQLFRNINLSYRQTLEDVLIISRPKYVKLESQATAKHKRHRLVFHSMQWNYHFFSRIRIKGQKRHSETMPEAWSVVSSMRSYHQTQSTWPDLRMELPRNRTTCQWWLWLPQHLRPKTFTPIGYSLISAATIATKRVIWLKTAGNLKRKMKRMPKRANKLKRN